MRTKGLWLIPLLALSFLAGLPISAVHAEGILQKVTQTSCNGATSCGTSSVPVSAGQNNILVCVGMATGTAGGAMSASGVSDTLGNSWTKARQLDFASGSGPFHLSISLWYATQTHGSANDACVISYTGSTIATGTGATSFFVLNANSVFLSSGVAGPTVSNTATIGALSYADAVLIGVVDMYSPPSVVTLGTGFTNELGGGALGAIMDQVDSSGANQPNTFAGTWTGSANAWGDIGAVFGIDVGTTVTVPCTFNQLQCWWYPMFFMLAFSGLFMFVAGVSKTPPKQAMHLFLSGLTFGSIVAVIFGILTIAVPLVLLILNTLYVVRFRGR